MEWIACADEMPEPIKPVYLYVKYPGERYDMYYGCYYYENAFYFPGHAPIAGTPLYWQYMTFPEPPKAS